MSVLINRIFLRNLAAVLLVAPLFSCSAGQAPVLLKLAELPNGGAICRVAILPFSNNTEYPRGEVIVTRVFASKLTEYGGFSLAQEGDVRKVLKQMRIIPGTSLNAEQIRVLVNRLDVQVVISGTVVEMQDKRKDTRKLAPSVAVIIRLHDGDSGRTLWTSYCRREGQGYRKIMHFGVVNTVSELVERMSEDIVELWFDKGMQKCES